MKRYGIYALLLAVILAALATALFASRDAVKEPAVAGAFYPADRTELGRMVRGFLAAAKAQPVEGRLVALISPHAGYIYSGQVAAYSYRHITDRPVDTVIIIGPSHYASFRGASVYAEGAWRTPLGNVKINEKLARSLIDDPSEVRFDRGVFAKEHSLEVQLPFLQQTLADFTIVPVLIGEPTQASFSSLADRLTEALRKNDRAIIVASTDLSHYHDAATAQKKDRKVMDAVSRMSVEELQGLLASNEGEACGGYPVLLTMMVARNLGATISVVFNAANSGDVTGDRSRVVGYAAMGLYRSPLDEKQKKELLALARKTVRQFVRTGTTPEAMLSDPRLAANGATFVTINRQHVLRGCIGNIQPVMPLSQSVIRNAVAASTQDPRFPPMRPEELSDMEVEVTVLSPLEPLTDVKDIRIGTHGLYLVKDGRSGIFLPQVPVEQGWDLPTYLEELCRKAGLPSGAWKEKGAQLFIFTADILK
jgi:MEMO1 family protein